MKFQFYLPRVIFFALTIFVFAENLFAENLERQKILSPLVEEFLFPNDEISHIFSENDFEAKLIPQTQFADLIKNFVFGKIAPEKMGFAEEKLYRLPKSEIENKNAAALDTSTVSKIMRSISKMQGMQYFSRSRKSWDELYSQAFRVENPDANDFSAAPDLNEGDANGLEIFAFLNDHTFGESVYKISYKQNQNEFLMLMENYSALTYGPVKAVKPGDLKMCVCVIDCGDEFLFYIGNYAEFKMISALKKRLNNSFEARLEAIYNWFKNQF
ncbi:MAG: hypothetical protein HDR35_05920 [Treponema sp.]|nr:hypothetical protein [Treponema sp.]